MSGLYIHKTSCISPQKSFGASDLATLQLSADNKLKVIEPAYAGIPSGVLRRMGKAVRIGVGAAMPLIGNKSISGVLIGTANGGMEDCIKFLNQIIEYEEGLLTPTNFVQSTPNAIAGQLGMISANKGYNITHSQRGLAFENAVLDAMMLVAEDPENRYIVGGVDEISAYNYNIEYLGGWYKQANISSGDLYKVQTEASIAGEGAAMFEVDSQPQNAVAALAGIHLIQTDIEEEVSAALKDFLIQFLPDGEAPDLLLSGENGDTRLSNYYTAAEKTSGAGRSIARFKHLSGEYPTASAFALWIACEILRLQSVPSHMWKYEAAAKPIRNILIYNNYKGRQHGFMLVKIP